MIKLVFMDRDKGIIKILIDTGQEVTQTGQKLWHGSSGWIVEIEFEGGKTEWVNEQDLSDIVDK